MEAEQDAVFSVSVQANPPPTVTWQFGGEAVDLENPESRTSQSDEDHSLTISPAQLGDSGVYTVLADNGLGQTARKQVELKVHPSRMPIEVSYTIFFNS